MGGTSNCSQASLDLHSTCYKLANRIRHIVSLSGAVQCCSILGCSVITIPTALSQAVPFSLPSSITIFLQSKKIYACLVVLTVR